MNPGERPQPRRLENAPSIGAGGSPPQRRERPSAAIVALWALVSFLALVFSAIAIAVTAAAFFSEHNTKVDPTTLPTGTQVIVVDGIDGPSTQFACPPLVGGSEASPRWCEDADHEALLIAAIAPLIALLAGGSTFLAGRRAWRLLRGRHETTPAPPLEFEPAQRYAQDSMPWGFWTAVVVVGGLTVLLDVACVVAWVEAGRIEGVAGPAFWSAILATVMVTYGRRRAYALDLDGPDLVWRAPLRTQRVPVSDVAKLEEGARTLLGERTTSLLLRDGSALPITVPNARHATRLASFVASLRSPN